MKLTINTPEGVEEYAIKSVEELKIQIEAISQVDMVEVWLEKDKGASMALFRNNDRAFLLYIPEEGDDSFHSVDHSNQENPDEEIEVFMLHGVGDTKKAKYSVDFNAGIKALSYFFENEDKDPEINWVRDSEIE